MKRTLAKFKASGRWWSIDALTHSTENLVAGIGPELTRSKSKPYGRMVAFVKYGNNPYKVEYLPNSNSRHSPYFAPRACLADWLCEVFNRPELRPRTA